MGMGGQGLQRMPMRNPFQGGNPLQRSGMNPLARGGMQFGPPMNDPTGGYAPSNLPMGQSSGGGGVGYSGPPMGPNLQSGQMSNMLTRPMEVPPPSMGPATQPPPSMGPATMPPNMGPATQPPPSMNNSMLKGGLMLDPNPSTFRVPPPPGFAPQESLPAQNPAPTGGGGLLGQVPGRQLVSDPNGAFARLQAAGVSGGGAQPGQQDMGNWLNDYRTAGSADGVPQGFTGTMNGRNYINGNPYAAEYMSQGTDPNSPSYAFQNILNMYGQQIGQLPGSAMSPMLKSQPFMPTRR